MAKMTNIFELQDNMTAKLRTINSELQKTTKNLNEAKAALNALEKGNVSAKVTIDDSAAKAQIKELEAQLHALNGKINIGGSGIAGSRVNSTSTFAANMGGNALKGLDSITTGMNKLTSKSWSIGMSIASAPFDMLEKGLRTLTSFQSIVLAIGAAKTFEIAIAQPIGLADEYTKAMISFTSQTGSKEKADKLMAQVQAFAIATPFSTTSTIDNAKFMLTQGFKQDKIIPMLTNIGDANAAVGGNEESMKRIVTAMGQIRGNGKISAQDMNQLTNANIPAYQYLADALHTTVAKLRSGMEHGHNIESNSGIEAILAGMDKQFHGTMVKTANETLEGVWSQIHDTVEQKVILPWGTGLRDGILPAFVKINDLLGKAFGGVNKLGDKVQSVGKIVGTWLGDKITDVSKAIQGVVNDPSWNKLSTMGKIKFAWEELIGEPLINWWNTSGSALIGQVGASIGTGLGTALNAGITGILSALSGDKGLGTTGGTAGDTFFSNFIKAFKPGDIIAAISKAFVNLQKDLFTGKDGWFGELLIGALDLFIIGKLLKVVTWLVGVNPLKTALNGMFGNGSAATSLSQVYKVFVTNWPPNFGGGGKSTPEAPVVTTTGTPKVGEIGGVTKTASKWAPFLEELKMLGKAAGLASLIWGAWQSIADTSKPEDHGITKSPDGIVGNIRDTAIHASVDAMTAIPFVGRDNAYNFIKNMQDSPFTKSIDDFSKTISDFADKWLVIGPGWGKSKDKNTNNTNDVVETQASAKKALEDIVPGKSRYTSPISDNNKNTLVKPASKSRYTTPMSSNNDDDIVETQSSAKKKLNITDTNLKPYDPTKDFSVEGFNFGKTYIEQFNKGVVSQPVVKPWLDPTVNDQIKTLFDRVKTPDPVTNLKDSIDKTPIDMYSWTLTNLTQPMNSAINSETPGIGSNLVNGLKKGFDISNWHPFDDMMNAISNMKLRFGGTDTPATPDFKYLGSGKPYPGYANGGFANKPSIFGEAGEEVAIPLSPSRRDRAYDLMGTTAQKLGIGNITSSQSASSNASKASPAPITVQFTGDNHFDSEMDIETIGKKLAKAIQDAMQHGGEGSYGF